MNDLNKMVSELRALLNDKSENLDQHDSYREGRLKLRGDEIDSFEFMISQVTFSPPEKEEVIKNFRQEAEKIRAAINKIK
jgi:hypothetical protein